VITKDSDLRSQGGENVNMHATQRGAAKARIGLALAVVLVSLIAVGPAQAAPHAGRIQPVSAPAVVAAAATAQAARHVARFQPVSAPVVASALTGANMAIAHGGRHVGKAFVVSASGSGAGETALVATFALLAIGLILALTSRPLAAGSASSAGLVTLRPERSPQTSTEHAA
jgi:hypothetical protein